MESFHWNACFITGLKKVDAQHHHLVDLINSFGNLIANNNLKTSDIESIFTELAEYAQYHFKEEEKLMLDIGIDQRHIKRHVKAHYDFLQEVGVIYSGLSDNNLNTTKYLLDFLTHWLVYHILGLDQNMAIQIKAIQAGSSANEAYKIKMQTNSGSATEALLFALNALFQQVSSRNKELMQLNKSLEEKVFKRTALLVKANLHLEELVLTDTLTGLPNRRHALRCLEDLWIEANKHRSDLVCMMIDVDYFKVVNDTYGHDAGDKVLRELSRTLSHVLRNDDVVCRLGGDEFLVICPHTGQTGGMKIAEIARKTVSNLRISTGDGVWLGSISIGVAAYSEHINNYNELIKMADKAVYIAKQAGKNCVKTIII